MISFVLTEQEKNSLDEDWDFPNHTAQTLSSTSPITMDAVDIDTIDDEDVLKQMVRQHYQFSIRID